MPNADPGAEIRRTRPIRAHLSLHAHAAVRLLDHAGRHCPPSPAGAQTRQEGQQGRRGEKQDRAFPVTFQTRPAASVAG